MTAHNIHKEKKVSSLVCGGKMCIKSTSADCSCKKSKKKHAYLVVKWVLHQQRNN